MKAQHHLKKDAETIFFHGLAAVKADAAVKRCCFIKDDHLHAGSYSYDLSAFKNIYVIGAGKATAAMAAALEEILADRITGGIINVKYGHVEDLQRIRLVEAGHPVPDEEGRQGAAAMHALALDGAKDDLFVCLLSGGGSALLPLPEPGLTLKDKQITARVLLDCGASIQEINAVRKHTSMIKGGRLARAVYPATGITLILSDVVGDDPDVIASGPMVSDLSTFETCRLVLEKYDIFKKLPQSVVGHIEKGLNGRVRETPKPEDPCFHRADHVIIGSNIDAVIAAEEAARNLGYNTLVLSSMIEGETKEIAAVHGAIAKEILKTGRPVEPPACILSGGETTVTIKGSGLGGRNQEFALAAAVNIEGLEKVMILSAGTDGTDGPTDAAGAFAHGGTCEKARRSGLDPVRHLADNNAYPLFKALDDLLITGPTRTNVMDLRILLVG